MAKQHEIDARKAQLIDSYGPDGLAQMVIDLTEELEEQQANLPRVKAEAIEKAVRFAQNKYPETVAPHEGAILRYAQRIIDEAGE